MHILHLRFCIMKKSILFIAFFIGCGFTASAQNCDIGFLGTKTLYKASAQKITPAPAGYKPVFINHVGRHGARHLTKDVNTTLAYTLLWKADSANALTAQGKQLKQMVNALKKVEKGNTKNISAEGADELSGLGVRICQHYSDAFGDKPILNVGITKEVRTKQSADAFLKGLNSQLKSPATISEYNDDTDLRFYDASPAYKKFEDNVDNSATTLALEKAAGLDEINNSFTLQFFNPGFLNGLSNDKKAKFTSDIFGFATIAFSLSNEIQQAGFKPADLGFKSFFTCDELNKLGMLDSADENLKKGPATDNNGIQVRVAVPLLVNFINTTYEFIKTGKYNAQLRFAHAETISPFAALLQIAKADKATTDIRQIDNNWKASDVIPLSANIQWIFYKKKGVDGYLVKILLNEKEARITGLNETSFPYYKWNDLRALYINKLIKLNVKLTDDTCSYHPSALH